MKKTLYSKKMATAGLLLVLVGCSESSTSNPGGGTAPAPVPAPVPDPDPVPDPYLCGQAINDTDRTNAAGACIKIVSNRGAWYTSSPSEDMLDAIGFSWYDQIRTENGSQGPTGKYPIFISNGSTVAWCNELNNIAFNGRTDWHVPTQSEVYGLSDENGKMFDAFGWPTKYCYEVNDAGNRIDLETGALCPAANYNLYVTCKSKD